MQSQSLLLTHSLLKLLTPMLVIYLNIISKGSRKSEYSIAFSGIAKLKPLHRTVFS